MSVVYKIKRTLFVPSLMRQISMQRPLAGALVDSYKKLPRSSSDIIS